MEGHRKSKDEKEDHHADRPTGDVEKWKNLRDNLDEHPADHGIGDREPVNIAPLQFAEEIALVHPEWSLAK
jgi:hypothetical protein